jgi:erythromycin esterase-like protein
VDDEYDRWIALLATTFRQWLEVRVLALQPDSRPWELRDRFMAENARTQLERFGRSTKGVVWAHNGHVSAGGDSDGAHLRKRLGMAYRSVGFAFSTGRISAGSVDADGRGDWRLATHTAHPPPEDSMESVLEQADLECYAVEPGNVPQLGRELKMRAIGAYCDDFWYQFSATGVPAECYDMVVYFREAHPSEVLPGPWAAL